jgi:methylenetetrahydrofolate dehydrogenase (NADP+)/methenyltetrahydrofolate cyclohydrolase
MLLSGQTIAKEILNATKLQIKEAQLKPGLGVVLVGNDAASHLYVGIKEKRAQELGIYFEKKIFPSNITQEEIIVAIEGMNADERLHGIIVQLPLPMHLDAEKIIAGIDPHKDTDGFHPSTIEKFLAGDEERMPVFPRAMLELVRTVQKTNDGATAVAIVNSDLMGEVLQEALRQEGYEAQYVLGDKAESILQATKEASVILTAVGKPEVFSVMGAQAQTIVIDGGIYYDKQGQVIGDVTRDDSVYRDDVYVTPVPGGVGPVTVAVLLARVTEAALRKVI